MKIFGKCFHRWKHKKVYYDCSDICMWSSGFVYFKYCKDCGLLMEGYEWLGKIEYKEIPKKELRYKDILNKYFKN